MTRFTCILACVVQFLCGSSPADDRIEFFEKEVRPLLDRHCFECHGPGRQENELRLDHIKFMLAGGSRGPAISLETPTDSLIRTAISYSDDDLQMPPDGPLSKPQRAVLSKWIELGMPWPDEPLPEVRTGSEKYDLQKRAKFWAWQPIADPEPPTVKNDRWNKRPIDRFIYDGLSRAGLRPAVRANRNRLVRRAYFGVIGLPPPVDAIPQADAGVWSDDQWESLIDQLLDSPRFGERWGRHWLDLVRYADSYGHESDRLIPDAWKYRDYVIRAFNADIPYDQFVREHIAGDLLKSPRVNPDKQFNESVIGTGFWFLHQAVPAPVDVRLDEQERIENQIDVFGKAFLGMTVACARCHDHKFDAISTEDYYALSGFMKSMHQENAWLDPGREIVAKSEQLLPAHGSLWASFRQQLLGSVKENRKRIQTLLSASHAVLRGDRKPSDAETSLRPDILFSSFEDGDVSMWHDDARFLLRAYHGVHGRDPSLKSLKAIHQPMLGKTRLDTSGRTGVPRIPGHIVHSRPFTITRNYIEFLSQGRGDQEERWFNLVVDDRVVHQLLAPDDPAVAFNSWDVRNFLGKQAYFVIHDTDGEKEQYLWVDQIVFSDSPEPYQILRPIAGVAEEYGISAAGLREWLEMVAERELTLLAGKTNRKTLKAEARQAATTRITADEIRGWQRSGQAFADQLSEGLSIRVDEDSIRCESNNCINSGRLSANLAGILRSPTFVLGHDTIHYHAAGSGGQLRLIIDNYQLRRFEDRLFEETYTDVDTGGRFDWFCQHRRLREYLGHRAYFEIVDPGDGYIAVDSIVLSNSTQEPQSDISTRPDIEPIVQRFLAGDATCEETDLLNALIDFELVGIDDSLASDAARYSKLAKQVPQPMSVLATVAGSEFDDRVHLRGVHSQLGQLVNRRSLQVFDRLASDAVSRGVDESIGRLQLAEQLVDESNPLLARVIVNRVWHHLMGRGIVASVDNFGVLGQHPSHPDLLDYLATRFRENDWSIKWLIRKIMQSETYRMSSRASDPQAELEDPDNRLFHRAMLRRLEGEVIRDSLLSVAGRLKADMFGPGIPVYIVHPDNAAEPDFEHDDQALEGEGRRSIYLQQRRNRLPPLALAFDLPVPDSTFGKRTATNTPAQALMMMNDPLVIRQSERLADRILETKGDFESRVTRLYLLTFARHPSAQEIQLIESFFDRQAEQLEMSPDDARRSTEAWKAFCHVLFTLKEFIYVG